MKIDNCFPMFGAKRLKLETLIKVKEETAGEKDKAALLILRRTLQERPGT